jgi:hypothetical protein
MVRNRFTGVQYLSLTGPNPILKPKTNAMIASELGMAQPRFIKRARRKAASDIVAAETMSNCFGKYRCDLAGFHQRMEDVSVCRSPRTLSKRAALNVTGILTPAMISAIVFELVGKTLDMICEE